MNLDDLISEARQPGGSSIDLDQLMDMARTEPSYAMDIAKSIPTGLAKGTAGLGGLPQFTGKITKGALDYIPEWATPPEISAIKSGASWLEENAPSAKSLYKGITDITGELHEPRTTPGKYAQTIAEFTPGMFLPGMGAGSVVSKFVRGVAAPAIGSETAGQLTEGTPYEPYARAGGALAGMYGYGRAFPEARAGGALAGMYGYGRAFPEATPMPVVPTRAKRPSELAPGETIRTKAEPKTIRKRAPVETFERHGEPGFAPETSPWVQDPLSAEQVAVTNKLREQQLSPVPGAEPMPRIIPRSQYDIERGIAPISQSLQPGQAIKTQAAVARSVPKGPKFDPYDPETWPKQGTLSNEDIGRVGEGRVEFSPYVLQQSRVPTPPERMPPAYEPGWKPTERRIPTSEYDIKYPEGFKPPVTEGMPRAVPSGKAAEDVTKFGNLNVGDNIGLNIEGSPSFGTVKELFTKTENGMEIPYARLTTGDTIELTDRFRSLGKATEESIPRSPIAEPTAEMPIQVGDEIGLKALGPEAKAVGKVVEITTKKVPVSIKEGETFKKVMKDIPYAKLDNGKEVDLTRFGRIGKESSAEKARLEANKKTYEEDLKTAREEARQTERPKTKKEQRREEAFKPDPARNDLPSAKGTMNHWYQYALTNDSEFARHIRSMKNLPKTEREFFDVLKYFYSNVATGSYSRRAPRGMVSALTRFSRKGE